MLLGKKLLVTLTAFTAFTAFTFTALLAAGGVVASNAAAAEHKAAALGFDGPLIKLSHLAKALDLTAGQKDEIRAILEKHKAELLTLAESEKTTRTALVDSIRQPATNAPAVRQASAAVARVDADLAVTRATIYSEVYAVLTPAQRDTLVATMDEWRAEISARVEAILSLVGHAL